MKIFEMGINPVAIVAIGVTPTGFLAIGAMATGVIAIGQAARGIIVCGQVCFGIVAVGQLSVGLVYCIGQLGCGPFGFGQLFLPLFPKISPAPLRKVDGRPIRDGLLDQIINILNQVLSPTGLLQLVTLAGLSTIFWYFVMSPLVQALSKA